MLLLGVLARESIYQSILRHTVFKLMLNVYVSNCCTVARKVQFSVSPVSVH